MIKILKKIFQILDHKQKKKLILCQLLLVLAATFELLGIFSIAPIIQLISDDQILKNENMLITKVYLFLDISSYKIFLQLISMIALMIFIINFILSLYTIYFITKFSLDFNNYLKLKLFKYYSLSPWIYHSQRETSSFVNKIMEQTNRIAQSAVLPLLTANAKLLVGISIIIFIFFYNPKVSAICFSIFFLSYFFIFKLIKKKIDANGLAVTKIQHSLYKKLIETFASIKETILHKKQEKFYNEFNSKAKEYCNVMVSIQFFQLSPRYFLELMAFSIVIISIIFISITDVESNLQNSLPILGVYIYAGYKLLPIFQAVYQGLISARACNGAVENVYEEIKDINSKNLKFGIKNLDDSKNLKLKNDIRFKNVSFSYLNSNKAAVKDITLNIKPNTLNSIVGPSGAGKSTILDLMLGLIEPQTGEILIDQISLKKNLDLYQNNISYVGQNVFLKNDTIRSNICFGEEDNEIDREKFIQAIEVSYLSDLIKELPDGTDTLVGERGIKISGGQRQRIAIARALYLDRSLIILDEATNSLDGITQNGIMQNLKIFAKNYNKTIVMVTHSLNLTKESNQIYLINNGSIQDKGTFNELSENKTFIKLLNQDNSKTAI